MAVEVLSRKATAVIGAFGGSCRKGDQPYRRTERLYGRIAEEPALEDGSGDPRRDEQGIVRPGAVDGAQAGGRRIAEQRGAAAGPGPVQEAAGLAATEGREANEKVPAKGGWVVG
jgi:hypothetical protein